ncbi:hypothetical protein A0J61_05305 [Choanephora cucurbitarum]|uniref:Uncharacterized protein n=1 Tax=Choanephora cucurbitarum TaxID=101091 RepID=A0A1C7NBY2_9FUNG|nr:hypothetical protein A0J61_05305 [Choanephora cucurbitarum]
MMHPLEQQNDNLGLSLHSDSLLTLQAESLFKSDSNEDSEEEDAKLDRISDILSSLIQEANEAVNQSDVKVSPPKPLGSIPMVRKLSSSSSSEQRQHQKRRVSRIAVRPLSYPSAIKRSAAVSSSSYSNPSNTNHTVCYPKHNHQVVSLHTRRPSSSSSFSHAVQVHQQGATEDVLMESFKRLDTSLAMIDSLSRDLAPPETNKPVSADQSISFVSAKSSNRNQINTIMTITNNTKNSLSLDSRLSALLLLPLLHVPHALISIAFESISNNDHHAPNNSLSGAFIWAILFAITNLVVDKALISPITIKNTPSENSDHKIELKEPPCTFAPSVRLNTTNTRMRRKSVNSKRIATHRRKHSFHQKQHKFFHDNTPFSTSPMQSSSFTSFVLPHRTLSNQPNLSRRYSI